MALPLANILFAPENWLILGVIALLLFGKRLPEVGRSLGKGIIEFKKGLAGIEDDINQNVQSKDAANRPALPPSYKFDPYTGKPLNDPSAPGSTSSGA